MSKSKIKFPLHDTHLHKSLGILRNACILAMLAPLCFYALHNVPHKNKYKTFYSNYDPIDAFDRMQTGGYLTSCPKDNKDGKNEKKK